MGSSRLPPPGTRQWSKKEWAIAAASALALLFLLFTLISDDPLSNSRSPQLPSHHLPTSDLVDLTLSRVAKERRAFCLDGSLPAYHFEKGYGSGVNSWLLHLEGGGWCNSIASCSYRKTTALGSSDHMERQVVFGGILSHDSSLNPDFYNWNRVKLRYCDGASFAGRPESEFKNETQLFFRGQLIWEALMDELLSMGLSNARQALLSGCSAGGLATLIHCDEFRDILPKEASVKCLSDAGFFLNEKDISGRYTLQSFYHDVVHLQGIAKGLYSDCVTTMEPSKCFFPQEIIKSIKTPVFLVNPAYDFWQIRNVLVPDSSDPHGDWQKCRLNIHNCNDNQIEILHGFRNSMLQALSDFQQNNEGGIYIDSCFEHCQTWMAETWHSPNSPRIANLTIAESVGEWYFNKRVVKLIDCPYPCNPTCA